MAPVVVGGGTADADSASSRTQPAPWPLPTRIAFRFAFAYLLLFYLSWSGFFAPFSLPFAIASDLIWGVIVAWVATGLLDVPAPPMVSDGDGLAQWIVTWGCVFFAALVTVVWSFVDRERQEYVKLHAWLRVGGRYALGIAMVVYGLAKIFHIQMLPPHLAKLVQPLGESSPTSLLWIFMGSSAAYSAFTGFVELLGGVLLFNRRTTPLGALVSLGAMSQVVVLNLAYDVSVKLWSINLMVLAAILLVPETRRLLNLLVLNRPTEPVQFTPLFRTPRRERNWFRVGMVFLAITLGIRVLGMMNARGSGYARTPTPLWGIHEVTDFTADGVERPPLTTDSERWRTLVIERSGLASVRFMDGSVRDYLTSVDTAAATVTFLPNPDTTITAAGGARQAYDPNIIGEMFSDAIDQGAPGAFTLGYARAADGDLTLNGAWRDQAIALRTDRSDGSDLPFLNRGFHWVQYYPYFR